MLARYYHTSLWHVVMDTNHNFHHNQHKNINTYLVGLDPTPHDLTPTPILSIAEVERGGGNATSDSLYTLLAPRQNPRCSVYTQCGACQGHCSHDDDCVGNLKCFERSWNNPYETPPGCVGEGVARTFVKSVMVVAPVISFLFVNVLKPTLFLNLITLFFGCLSL